MLVPFMGKRREERGKYLLTLVRQAGDWENPCRLLVQRFESGGKRGRKRPRRVFRSPESCFEAATQGVSAAV